MNLHRIPSPWRALLAVAALLPAQLVAQVAPTSSSTTPTSSSTTPPATLSTSSSGQQDEAIRLATFTVVGDEDGYYAPAAVSGTRTKTELINLPMNLNVLTEQFIKDIGATDLVGQVELHRQVTGHGQVVLLTHGFGASSHMFASTVAALAPLWTAIAWDMRGHGRSEVSADPSA